MSASPASQPAEAGLVSAQFHRVRRAKVVRLRGGAPPPPREVARRPAHVARMLALAHHVESAIGRGLVASAADVASQLGFTRARVTHLLDLLLLAPDIQEEVLFLEAVEGEEPLSERGLRAIAHAGAWEAQRERWCEVKASF
ncbi:hypothetical protein [Myxococcus xanthus]|uniref:hypothetical protein n=1 Tax=Myxococcus xanthus TaxID=34 RepID=UPI0004765CF0|nr:hypothetical protein [Myxococcus xanthus]QVW70538.1 hypothetical protein JTM82_13710 [Myxococcus xanthus DZ2]QZZ49418.1 hypothetical protein MyxoNM_09415 [Myxococcus xanthus]UEO03334.1 hypothetical protein K1515_29105 [Myxococcus xanthus DZ2]UYI16501.1 hypothetical protein N3T43_09330 [Myxococcus xanthus]UYI23863.1 hypothetical protein N1129_09330 [Myxococcus xanthus]